MRKISIEFLEPGMVVAKPIYTNDGMVLLAKDAVLTADYIKRLNDKDIRFIYVMDDLSEGIEINDVVSDKVRVKASRQIKEAVNKAKNIANSDVDFVRIKLIVDEIINDLLHNSKSIYELLDQSSPNDFLFSHSVNVCILSTMTGLAMDYSKQQLKELAVGAFLHDIGNTLISPQIFNKPAGLDIAEILQVRKHPAYSYEILKDNKSISNCSKLIVYQHHERYNGEGYPLGIKKDDIGDMSQVVGIADIYEAMTSERPYRKALPAKEAYEYISGTGDYFFKYDLVRIFLSQIAVYSTGSVVRLSNGQVGIVKENIKGAPLSPNIRLIMEKDGTRAVGRKDLELCKTPSVVIEKVLDDEEINQIKIIMEVFSSRNKNPFLF